MASFAETTQVPFSDIAAFPVELYGRVGMMKQAMYDSNTAKVQAFHDSIAGLDIIKEPQKAYLSEQLSKLRTNLGSLAGADFSKQSVVNQAAAMAGPLSKDPTIQGAVLSTAAYRKGLSDIEKAKKENLFSPSNTWDFQNEANNWLTDGKVDSSFNHQYTPYTDVRKTAAEALKLLHPNITESDIAFNEDDTLNDALIRKKAKDLSPQQIRNALQATFTPNDYKQLDIDGRFKYQGTSPQRLKEVVTAHSQAAVKKFEDTKREIDNTMSTASGATYTSLKEKSDALQAQIDNITNSYSDYHTMIDSGDPQQLEQAKSLFHSNSFLNNYSAAFAYGEHSQTIENNPIMQMRMEKLRFQQAEEHWQADFQLKLKEFEQKERELGLKAKELKGTYGDYEGTVPNQDVSQANIVKALDAEKKALDMSKAEMEARYSNGDPLWYTRQQELYEQGKYKNVSPVMQEHFRNREIQQGDYDAHASSYKKIVAEAEAKFPLSYTVKAGTHGVKVGNTEYHPVEVAAMLAKMSNEGIDFQSLAPGKGLTQDNVNRMRGILTPKERALFDRAIRNATPEDMAILRQINNIRSNTVGDFKKVAKDRQDLIATRIKETTGLGATQVISLGNTDAQRNQMKQIVSDIVGEADRTGMGFSTEGLGDGSTPKDVAETLRKGDASYSLVVMRGQGLMPDQYGISVAGKANNFRQLVPITAAQKNRMFGNIEAGESGDFTTKTQSRIISTGNGSTNHNGTKTDTPADLAKTLSNPYLKRAHFPNVKRFSVRGDIETGNSPESVNAKLYIFDPKKNIWTPTYLSQGMLDYGLLNKVIASLTDDKIYQLLYDGKKPTQADLDEIEKLSEVK